MAGGRPTVYKAENAEIARHAGMLGATNETLAERFEVSRRTIDSWIATIAEFGDAVRHGRHVASTPAPPARSARRSSWSKEAARR